MYSSPRRSASPHLPHEVKTLRGRMAEQLARLEASTGSMSAAEGHRAGAEAASLLRNVQGLLEGVEDLERAWRVHGERAAFEAQISDVRVAELRGELASKAGEAAALRDETVRLASALDGAHRDVQLAYREADERVARAQAVKAEELDSWRTNYQQEMRSYVQSRLGDTRAAAIRETEAVSAATLEALESTYRERLDDVNARLSASFSAEEAAVRETAATHSRLVEERAHSALLASEVASLQASLNASRAEVAESKAVGSSLADEVLRLRSLLAGERTASDEMQRAYAARLKQEGEAAAASRAAALESEASAHAAEVHSLQRAFDSAVRSREEAAADWHARYVGATSRAEHAETLVRAIDRQLAPLAAAAAAQATSSSSSSGDALSSPTPATPSALGRSAYYTTMTPSAAAATYSSPGGLATATLRSPLSSSALAPTPAPTPSTYLGARTLGQLAVASAHISRGSSPTGDGGSGSKPASAHSQALQAASLLTAAATQLINQQAAARAAATAAAASPP